MRVPVRFIRGSAPYNTGEIAGFDREEAQALVEAGAAVFLNAEDAPPPAADEASEGAETEEVAAGDEATGLEAGGEVDEADPTPLPEGFPLREALIAAGIETVEAVPRTQDDLVAIDGIGPGYAQKILAALGA